MDRAEHSKRQDWSLEAAYDIFPLLDPLLSYTVATLLDKSNVLRDSVLMQAECLHFEAYVHVCTIMWRVVFKELRGLTNSKVGTLYYALSVVCVVCSVRHEYVSFLNPMFVVCSRVFPFFKSSSYYNLHQMSCNKKRLDECKHTRAHNLHIIGPDLECGH